MGLISDTHGVFDPRVLGVFAEYGPLAAIVHAGDVGPHAEVLWELEALAPVTAVLGNSDHFVPGWQLSGLARTTVAGCTILVVHDIESLGQVPSGVDVIVRGHTHVPSVQTRGHVLVVNPGSASQRRRMPSRSVAILEIAQGEAPRADIIMLDDFGK